MELVHEIVRIKQVLKKGKNTLGEQTVRSPKDGADLAVKLIGDDDREVLLVMALNTKNQVVAVHRAHIGSLNASICHPREVFKACILNNAASLIISHQHPSTDPTPSREDIELTKRIAEAGKILGIELLDHLIVGMTGKHVSLKEKGYV